MTRADLPVYAWVTGQQTNIGDSLLRRPYLRLLSGLGSTDVWVRNSTDAFLSGVEIDDVSKVSRRFSTWWLRAMLSAIRRPTVVAVNAGEVPDGRAAVVAGVALAVLTRLATLRGGQGLWLGGSVPSTRSPAVQRVYRALASSSSIVSWREQASQSAMGVGSLQPDWGFGEGTDVAEWPDGERRAIAIVMRGDREPPTPEWLRWVKDLAATHELSVHTVVQVEADNDLAEEIAEQLGGSCMNWSPGADHATQEERARRLYRTCLITVGDRLHGLVAAATEGSVPLGWVPSSRGKIAAHFSVIGIDWVGAYEGDRFGERPTLTPDLVQNYVGDVRRAIADARHSLQVISGEVRGAVGRDKEVEASE